MNDKEANLQTIRVDKYNRLTAVRDNIRLAIDAIAGDLAEAAGPFTSDTRESRQVVSMHIKFTATRGGAPAVDMLLAGLHIEASELGRKLEGILRNRLTEVQVDIEKI